MATETERVIVVFEGDESSARVIAQGLVDALDQVFTRATSTLGDRLEKPLLDMLKTMQRVGKSGKDAFDDMDAAIKRTARTADAFATTMAGIGKTTAGSKGILDPRVFDATNQSFNRLEDNIQRIITNFGRLSQTAGGRQVLGDLTAAIRSQANQANVVQQSMTRVAEQEAKARTEAARVGLQRTTALEVAASKERIVAAQQAGSQTLAATRAANQQRVAIFQAAVNQIRALERGLGTVFSTTASTLSRAFAGVGRALSTALSRGNREMTSGLQSSLTTRQGMISRSFHTQEQTISSSITRQTQTLDRFEAQLSGGVAGFATGRSKAANALGIGGLAVGGFGLMNVLKSGLTAGADFTAGLAVLDAQLQLTDEQMAAVRQTALNLGNDMTLPGVSALDAAQAIQQLAKQFGNLGVEAPAAAIAAAKGVLQLSRATGAASEDAAQVVGAAINVFKVPAAEAVLVADQVANALSKAAGTSFTDFSAAFKQGATVFAQFQVPALGAKDALLEFNTALAVMAQGGLVGSDAGTSIRSFFLQANRGTDEANKALREISERAGVTGTAFFEADGDARGLGDTLEILRAGLQGLTDQERSSKLFELFGSDAVRAAEILTNTTGPAFDAMRDQLRREGTAAELAAAQNQGLRGAMDALGSTIETNLILAYEKFQVVLGNAVLVFANFINNLASGEGVFAMLRTALKGIGIGLGALVGIKAIAEGFGFLRVAIGALLSPLGLVVLAFAGIGAAFAILMDKSEEFRAFVDEVKTGFQAMVDTFRNPDLGSPDDGFIGFMQTVGVKAREVFETVRSAVVTGWTATVEFVRDFISGLSLFDEDSFFGTEGASIGQRIGQTVASVFVTVRDALVTAWNATYAFIQDFIGGVTLFDPEAAFFGEEGASIGERIGSTLRNTFEAVKTALVTAFGGIIDFVGGFMAGAPSFSEQVMETLFPPSTGTLIGRRAREIFDTAVTAIRGFAENVAEFLTPAVNVLKDLGGALVDIAKANPTAFFTTLGAGIAGALGGFAVAGPIGAVVGGLGGGLGALFAQGFGDEIVDGLKNIGSFIVDGIKRGVAAAQGALSRVFSVDNLIDFTLFASGLAQKLGRVLGNVLSDPRLVAGAAGVAAAAALLAARFVIGFGEGVLSNVPELGRMLLDGIEAALEAGLGAIGFDFIDLPVDWLVKLLLPVGAVAAVVAAFRKLGGLFNKSINEGLQGPGVANAGGLTNGPKSFIDGLLGSQADLDRTARRAAADVSRSFRTEFDRLNRQIGAVGGNVVGDLSGRIAPNPADLKAARDELGRLNGVLGESRVQGAFAADAIGRIGSSLRNLNFSGAITGFRDLAGVMKNNARDIGVAAGTALGAGVAAGFSLSMVANSKGAGDTALGLAGFIGSIATATAIGGPKLGALAAGIGAVTFAFTQAQKAAEKAKAEVDEYANALEGLADEDLSKAGLDVFFENIKDESPAVVDLLEDIGFNAKTFVDDIVEGTGTGAQHFTKILTDMGAEGVRFAETLRRDGVDSADEFEEALRGTGEGVRFRKFLEDTGVDAVALADVFDLLTDESNELHTGLERAADTDALRGIADDAVITQSAIGGLRGEVAILDSIDAHNNLEAALQNAATKADEAKTSMELAKIAADELLNGSYQNTLEAAVDNILVSIPGIQSQIEGLADLPPTIAAAVQRGIGDDIKVDLLAAVQVGLKTGEITDPAAWLASLKETIQGQIDQGLLPVEAGAAIIAGIDSLVAGPTFATDMATLFQAIVDNGVPPVVPAPFTLDPVPTLAPDAATKLGTDIASVLSQLNAGSTGGGPFGLTRGPAAGGGEGGQVVDLPVTVNPVVTISTTYGTNLAAALATIRTGAKPGTIDVAMTINPILTISPAYGTNLAAALAALRNTGAKPGVINVPMVINPIFTVAGGAFASALGIGVQLSGTIATGVSSGAGRIAAAVAAAVTAAVIAAIAAAAAAAGAGALFAARLAAGIATGAGAVSAAANAVVGAAVTAASAASAAAGAAGRAFAAAFAGGIRSGTGAAVSAAAALGAAASAAVRTSQEAAVAAGRNIAAGLARGIQSGAGAAIGAARSLAAQVTRTIESAMAIGSPSKVTEGLGVNVSEGFAGGIEKGSEKAEAAAKELADKVRAAMEGATKLLIEDVETDLTSFRRLIGNTDNEALKASLGERITMWESHFNALNAAAEAPADSPLLENTLGRINAARGELGYSVRQAIEETEETAVSAADATTEMVKRIRSEIGVLLKEMSTLPPAAAAAAQEEILKLAGQQTVLAEALASSNETLITSALRAVGGVRDEIAGITLAVSEQSKAAAEALLKQYSTEFDVFGTLLSRATASQNTAVQASLRGQMVMWIEHMTDLQAAMDSGNDAMVASTVDSMNRLRETMGRSAVEIGEAIAEGIAAGIGSSSLSALAAGVLSPLVPPAEGEEGPQRSEAELAQIAAAEGRLAVLAATLSGAQAAMSAAMAEGAQETIAAQQGLIDIVNAEIGTVGQQIADLYTGVAVTSDELAAIAEAEKELANLATNLTGAQELLAVAVATGNATLVGLYKALVDDIKKKIGEATTGLAELRTASTQANVGLPDAAGVGGLHYGDPGYNGHPGIGNFVDYKAMFEAEGRAAALGLAAGMEAEEDQVAYAAFQMANSAAYAVQTALQIGSPSRVMAGMGAEIGAGLVEGMEDSLPDVSAAAKAMAEAAMAPLAEGLPPGSRPETWMSTWKPSSGGFSSFWTSEGPHAAPVPTPEELAAREAAAAAGETAGSTKLDGDQIGRDIARATARELRRLVRAG